MRADFLDRYARGNTVFHRLDPRTKLLLVLLIVIGVLLTPVGAWPVFGFVFCFRVCFFLSLFLSFFLFFFWHVK